MFSYLRGMPKWIAIMTAIPVHNVFAQTDKHYPFLTADQIKTLNKRYKNLRILHSSKTEHILTHLRNKDTKIHEFRNQADRVIRILLEKALSTIQKSKVIRQAPHGLYDSHEMPFKDEDFCIVTILRAGTAFQNEAMKILPGASIGQLLIQRNTDTVQPFHYYSKLPSNIETKQIILVDPTILTGGSACMAIDILLQAGVKEDNITFLNIVSCEDGIKKLFKEHPKIRIITSHVDPILIQQRYLAPGLGEFGDRYYGTSKN